MADYVERDRLRHAGRIPDETLRYLEAKGRRDRRMRWWELPIYVVVGISIVFLILLLSRSQSSSESLRISVWIFLLVTTLILRIRQIVA